MKTKYSSYSSEKLAGELIVNKKKYDKFYPHFSRQKKIFETAGRGREGRRRESKRLMEKYYRWMDNSLENLEEMYFEYLNHNDVGDKKRYIPELVENPEVSANELLYKHKNFSEEIKDIWNKNKKIPKRGTQEGEKRHNNIEKMKNIEKEIYKRIFKINNKNGKN